MHLCISGLEKLRLLTKMLGPVQCLYLVPQEQLTAATTCLATAAHQLRPQLWLLRRLLHYRQLRQQQQVVQEQHTPCAAAKRPLRHVSRPFQRRLMVNRVNGAGLTKSNPFQFLVRFGWVPPSAIPPRVQMSVHLLFHQHLLRLRCRVPTQRRVWLILPTARTCCLTVQVAGPLRRVNIHFRSPPLVRQRLLPFPR